MGATIDGISLSHVTFSYGTENIFEDFSLTVPRHEVWSLVGRSGVGKTTLINIVLGLFAPTLGQITIDGKRVNRPGMIKGVMFQGGSLMPWLSAEENVLFPLCGYEDKYRDAALSLLDSVGLSGKEKLLPKQMSGGMQKRVELARALFADDEYFVADEPFGGLDALTRVEMWRMWRKLRPGNARTGIICTHDPLEAAVIADKVLVLKEKDCRVVAEEVAIPSALLNAQQIDETILLHDFRVRLMELL